MTVLQHMRPSGQPRIACGRHSVTLEQRCSSCLWLRDRTETNELSGSRGHLAASIPNASQPHSPLAVETLSCEVRGHTNSPTPSSFSYTVSSISVHHALTRLPFLHLISYCVTLWSIDPSGGEIISWSVLPIPGLQLVIREHWCHLLKVHPDL